MLPLPRPGLTIDGRVDCHAGLLVIYTLCALPQKAFDELKRRAPRDVSKRGPQFPKGSYAAKKEAELRAKIRRDRKNG